MNGIFEKIMPFFLFGIFIVLFIIGLFIFSYLLIVAAVIGLILFAIAYIRAKLFGPAKPHNEEHRHQQPKSSGRTIDHDDI